MAILPQEPDRRPGETLRAFLGPSHRRRRRPCSSSTRDDALAASATRRRRRVRARARALPRASARPTSTRVPPRSSSASGLPASTARRRHAGDVGRPGRARVARGDPALSLRRVPARRADQRPRLRADSTCSRTFLARTPTAASSIVSHDRAFLDRTITSSSSSTSTRTEARSTQAAGARTSTSARSQRRHAEEEYETYQAKRATLGGARAATARVGGAGRRRRSKKSGETDKFIRHFRTQSSERLAGKARATDRALERLEADAVDKPWEGWELRMEVATAPRSGDVVARLDGATVRRGDLRARSDRPRDRLRRTRRDPRRERQRQDDLARTRCSASCPLDAGDAATRTVGASSAGSTRRRDRFTGDDDLLDAFQRATGADLSACRSTLAKFGLGAEHVLRPARDAVARRAHPRGARAVHDRPA